MTYKTIQTIQQIRKTIHEQNEKFNREIAMTEENRTEILKLKNIMNKIKNAIENTTTKMHQTEESICEAKDRLLEFILSK